MCLLVCSLQKVYSVSFQLLLTADVVKETTSVLHFTTGKNWQEEGSRIPAVWIKGENSPGKLHICSSINHWKNVGEEPSLNFTVNFKPPFFKQSLIYMQLSFKKVSFNKKLYFLVEIKQHFFEQFFLKMDISSNKVG